MNSTLSSKERAVFLELSKNSRISDRELAQRLKTSQPTVTRIRTKLFQESFIDRFIILPNLQKLGLNFQAMTFIKAQNPATVKKVMQWANDHSNVVFAGEGEGIRMSQLLIHSLHGDFSEYSSFAKELKTAFAGQLADVDAFYLDSKSISKYYHWHSVIEERLRNLKEFYDANGKKVSRREQLSLAWQNLSQLKERIPSIPKVNLSGSKEKETKESEASKESEEEK